MKTVHATMTTKGQVTIPKEVRDALRLQTGARIAFVTRDDGVVELRPQRPGDVRDLAKLLGPAPVGAPHIAVEQIDEVVSEEVDRHLRERRRS